MQALLFILNALFTLVVVAFLLRVHHAAGACRFPQSRSAKPS